MAQLEEELAGCNHQLSVSSSLVQQLRQRNQELEMEIISFKESISMDLKSSSFSNISFAGFSYETSFVEGNNGTPDDIQSYSEHPGPSSRDNLKGYVVSYRNYEAEGMRQPQLYTGSLEEWSTVLLPSCSGSDISSVVRITVILWPQHNSFISDEGAKYAFLF